MTLQRTLTFAGIISAMFLTALLIGTLESGIFTAHASAPPGLQATISTTSLALVSTTAVTVIATSTCNARIISTASTSVMLTFSDYANQTPNNTFGIYQAASTTVAYDSGQYGCGLVKAYGFTAGQITVADVR